MNEARPFASLSSGLLARKGAAKPAMRPQGFTGGFEDLGWNDMGHEPSRGARRRAARACAELDRGADSGAQASGRRPTAPSPRWSPSSARSPRASQPEGRVERGAGAGPRRPRRSSGCPSARRRVRRAGGAGQEGRLHPAPRRRAPSSPPPRQRRHRPLGAADRDRGARPVPRVHSRSRSAGRAGSRLGRQEKLTRKGRSDDQDRLQSRRLHPDRRDDDDGLQRPVGRAAPLQRSGPRHLARRPPGRAAARAGRAGAAVGPARRGPHRDGAGGRR